MLISITLLATLTGTSRAWISDNPSDPIIFDKTKWRLSAIRGDFIDKYLKRFICNSEAGGMKTNTSTHAANPHPSSQVDDQLIALLTAVSNDIRFSIADKLARRQDPRIVPFIGYIALNDNSTAAQKSISDFVSV